MTVLVVVNSDGVKHAVIICVKIAACNVSNSVIVKINAENIGPAITR